MKRRLLILAIFLLLGAVVNVAVAWGCVAVIEPASCCEIAPAEIRAIMGRQRLVEWDRYPKISGDRYRGFGRERVGLRDATAGLRRFPARDFLLRETCGWPFQSLVAWHDAADGLIATRTDRAVMARGILLPIGPVYLGLVLGSAFYASVLWLLISGSFALRRFLRARRGLCPKCAYPMGESAVCTECGKPLPRRRRMPNPT